MDHYPVSWRRMQYTGGAEYDMPIENQPETAVYDNPALLKKVGMTTPPRTWAEVAADAAKVSALGSTCHGIAWTPDIRRFWRCLSAAST